MRDVKRIERIMELFKQYWLSHPDERFGQMIINIGMAPDDNIVWHIEDDKMEEHLKKLQENS